MKINFKISLKQFIRKVGGTVSLGGVEYGIPFMQLPKNCLLCEQHYNA